MQRWLDLLKEHYSAPLDITFKQFRLGAMMFFLGGMMIYAALSSISPSLQQEIVLLCGLVMGGIGLLIALLAHMRMIISRIVQFFSKPPES